MKFIRAVLFCILAMHAFVPWAWARGPSKVVSFGTGFVVAEGGYIVTANHLLQGKGRILVGPVSGKRWAVATVVKVNEKDDLALLKAKVSGKPLFIAPWSDVPVGLEAFAIGYPLPKMQGLTKKITQGIVNGDRTKEGDAGLFQFSAEIHKGNSGGPVLAPDGSVIGVVRAKLNALKVAERTSDLPQNVNYAIKSSTLLNFLQESGVLVSSRRLNLASTARPYEIFLQTSDSVVAVLVVKNEEPLDEGVDVEPSP